MSTSAAHESARGSPAEAGGGQSDRAVCVCGGDGAAGRGPCHHGFPLERAGCGAQALTEARGAERARGGRSGRVRWLASLLSDRTRLFFSRFFRLLSTACPTVPCNTILAP